MISIKLNSIRILPTSRYYKDHLGSSKPFHHNLLLLGCWLWYYNIPSRGWKVCEHIVDCNAMTRLGHLNKFQINVTGVPERFISVDIPIYDIKFTYGQCFASIVQWIKTVVLFSWIRSVIQTFFIGKNAVWTLVACYAVRYMCSIKNWFKIRFKDNLKVLNILQVYSYHMPQTVQ